MPEADYTTTFGSEPPPHLRARRARRWAELYRQMGKLEPGVWLQVTLPDPDAALKARSAAYYYKYRYMGETIRLVTLTEPLENGKAKLWITCVQRPAPPVEIEAQ